MKYAKVRQHEISYFPYEVRENLLSSFMVVDKRYLKVDLSLEFRLYAKNELEMMSLFLDRDTVIDEQIFQKIHKTQNIYISQKEKEKFNKFLEKHIQDLVKNNELNVQEKTDLLYRSTAILTDSLYSNPEALENVQRSKQIVNPIMQSIMHNNSTIASYMKIIAYDYYTYTHSLNVSIYSLCLGAELGLQNETLNALGRSALLHDLGKSRIDNKIVNKKERLNDKEKEIMKLHPAHGYNIALKLGIKDQRILDGIRHHHEKLNGSGYPDKLDNDHITLFPRIIGVCDVFDAMTTERSYKKAMHSYDALLFMETKMSHHLDIKVLKTFIKMLHN